jgi:hypothetical protein
MENTRRAAASGKLPGVVAVGVLAFAVAGEACAQGVPFVRGDANSDGRVSISDVHYLTGWFFQGSPGPECLSSGDVDDSGFLNFTDAVRAATALFEGAPAIPAPFPDSGADPTPDPEAGELCASYGNGTTLADPAAALRLLDSTAEGGENRLAVVTVTLSNSRSLGAYSARLDGGGIVDASRPEDYLAGYEHGFRDRSPFPPETGGGMLAGRFDGDDLIFGRIVAMRRAYEFLPGEDVPVLDILLCLKPGTAAGTYPLTLEEGELSASCLGVERACPDTGRAILPALHGGTLTVLADVTEGECDTYVPPPPPPVRILFQLAETTGFPGGGVEVPFSVMADRPTQGFSYSVKFDPAVLECTGTQKLWQTPSGTPYEFEQFECNNTSGHAVGAAVISLTDSSEVLPVDQLVEVLRLDFAISSSAATGSTPLEFQDGGAASGRPVNNKIIASGVDVTPALASSFVFVNGLINIVPDGSPFVRGDSNLDQKVNITDASYTLDFLFVGGAPPRCADAADANDDGALNISDAVMTLQFLFQGGRPIPAPYPANGVDATPDDLHCLSS